MDENRKLLLAELDSAFPDRAAFEGSLCETTLHQDYEDVVEIFAGRPWREITLAALNQNREAFWSLKRDAQSFFLPALIRVLLEDETCEGDVLYDYVEAVCEPWHSEMLNSLTPEQQKVVTESIGFLSS